MPLMLIDGKYEVLIVGVAIVLVNAAAPFGRPLESEAYRAICRVSPGDEAPVLNEMLSRVPVCGMMQGKKLMSVVVVDGFQLEA